MASRLLNNFTVPAIEVIRELGSTFFEVPKSITFKLESFDFVSKMRFSGFKSRWTIF